MQSHSGFNGRNRAKRSNHRDAARMCPRYDYQRLVLAVNKLQPEWLVQGSGKVSNSWLPCFLLPLPASIATLPVYSLRLEQARPSASRHEFNGLFGVTNVRSLFSEMGAELVWFILSLCYLVPVLQLRGLAYEHGQWPIISHSR
jgi:hypothetical protein